MATNPLLALTMGEPGGVAPDITLQAWQELKNTALTFFVVGDLSKLRARAKKLQLEVPLIYISKPEDAHEIFKTALPILPLELENDVVSGTASPDHAKNVISSIDRCVDFALNGKVQGIVTNPIQKESLYQAGFNHQGHTDYLAHLAREAGKQATPVMMLSSSNLRTVPVTVHIPLRDVATSLTKQAIVEQTTVVDRDLRKYFGIKKPRIGITGLNPHAGENRTIGLEERDIIEPAVHELREADVDVSDPLPADTVFHEEARSAYDCFICMYHDQALIPVKTIGFHEGVNTTLGLPFIRTSPDHGTALSLAGTGRANPLSLISAIRQAAQMAQNVAQNSAAEHV